MRFRVAALLAAAAVLGGAWWHLRAASHAPRGRDGRAADAVGGAPAGGAADPASSFTIYLLGGSTALGEPYAPRADLGRIAAHLLGGHIRGRPISVVNLGGNGKFSAAVPADAERIVRSHVAPGSAVAFLYLGNNEFIRFDRRHDLGKSERSLFDEPMFTPQERTQVLAEYRQRIERIVTTLQGAGVPAIASTAAVNMKDWDPGRSVLADPVHGDSVRALLGAGDRSRAAGDARGALESYRAALALEPGFALASKRAGDCARALGHVDAARKHYQDAVDHDGNSLRETSEENAILEEVCARHAVPVVDAVSILEAASPDHLLGYELFWDNCHPTLQGYALLAAGFVARMEPLFGVHRERDPMDLEELERALGIDAAFRAAAIA